MKSPQLKVMVLTVLLLYAYFFLEWLFFITKPSFLTTLSGLESVSVLFVAPLPFLLISLIILLVLIIPEHLVAGLKLTILVPALILSALVFMLVDNFTHTVFNFYAGTYGERLRYGYAALFILFFVLSYIKISKWQKSGLWQQWVTFIVPISIALPLISSAIFLLKLTNIDVYENEIDPIFQPHTTNILILSSDGLDAGNLSAYGYERQTTPFIDSFFKDSLISENSFSNNTQTTGSIAALFSGKLPTKTKVIFPPSIFNGVDIFQHFAGLLREQGYRNLEIGIPHYADSYDLNMRNAFDESTFRTLEDYSTFPDMPNSVRYKFSSELFFHEKVIERISSRLAHILGINDMVDPFKLVTDRNVFALTDEYRMSKLFDFLAETEQKPFFAHVHFMETHGPMFSLSKQLFSKDQQQNQEWMADFYDDTILNFDTKVKQVVRFLEQHGLLDSTIIVLTTDHGNKWGATNRIPLIIRFPDGSNKGRITNNTQRADIPPTLLDYLGVSQPEWMDGDSLISSQVKKNRVIFVAKTAEASLGDFGKWNVINYIPPFYALGKLLIIQCQFSYQLDLTTWTVDQSLIKGHTEPCDPEELPTKDQAKELMIQHLRDANYEISNFVESH